MRYRPECMDRPGGSSAGYNGNFTERLARDGYENTVSRTRPEIEADRKRIAFLQARAKLAAHRCDEASA